jgi:hypothetical protein
VTAAARSLRVPSADLRNLVWPTPSLADAIYEQIEQAIDAAEAGLFVGLRSLPSRLEEARNVMSRTREPQAITLKWIDT